MKQLKKLKYAIVVGLKLARDVVRQVAQEFQLSQDNLEAYRFCWGCGREEAVTSTKKLHEVGVHSHYSYVHASPRGVGEQTKTSRTS